MSAGEGPFPAVLLISGSGLHNRDQELFGHKPFWIIADHLGRGGVAVLRVDDAGAGESTPHASPPTTTDFARDAAALAEGGNRDVTVHRLPGLNHLFQPAGTGLVGEYGAIEETIAPQVLELIRDWLPTRVRP